jgi:twitching motility protein PilT
MHEQLTSIDGLLEQMVALGASDLHVTVGSAPAFRVRGHIVRADGFDVFTADDTRALLYRILSSEQQKHFELNRQLDFAYSMPGLARFRVNVYYQREAVGAAFRLIPQEIKSLEELSLPHILHQLSEYPRGLVLVTGPTGSGKSTTLAAIIDEINRNRAEHILTVEDPIEFVHRHKRCIVNQREIGPDATSFGQALKAALRQDPDVILVGEMRDLETISTALTAAETGHLVFGTLHTQSAPSTIDRIIDVFPPEQQEQVRIMLAGSLQAVGRRRPEPHPSGEDRAGLLRHADEHGARHADDGAGARRPRDSPRRRSRPGLVALEPARPAHRHPRALGLRREERARPERCTVRARRTAADTRLAHGRRLT